MSLTRTQLRRNIARRTGQPFFRKFGGGSGIGSASGSTTTLIDTALLLEEDNYWRGHFIYFPATDEVREVSAFANSTSTVTWLAPIASGTTNSTVYELWSQFTPNEVHDAINFALAMAWPFFFEVGNDESLVIEENQGLIYTLPTAVTIKRLAQVYIKMYQSTYTGTITTEGTTTQIIDANANFVAADVGKWISVYKDGGSANGEVRQIATRNSATQVTVSSAFTAAAPEDAKFRLLNKNDPYPQEYLLHNWVPDSMDNPTTIWLGGHPGGYEGHLLYILYENEYAQLSAEPDTTTCPPEFVYNAALSYLYLQKIATAPVTEVPAWEALLRAATESYERFQKMSKFSHMPATIIRHDTNISGLPGDYPFR